MIMITAIIDDDDKVGDYARDEDPVIFGLPDPPPVLFSLDPDPDPTCNNGFIKLFSS